MHWTARASSRLARSARSYEELADELRVVEFAVVEEDVCVGVCGDGERALPDACADQGPGFALTVPKADSAVAKVVRRPGWGAGCFAGSRDRRSQALLG